MANETSLQRGGRPSAFTPERRGRLLDLLADGMTLERARAVVGVSDSTIRRVLARADAGHDDAQVFAVEYRQRVRDGRAVRRPSPTRIAQLYRAGGLSRDDVVSLLEDQARAGNVTAIMLLLMRHGRHLQAA